MDENQSLKNKLKINSQNDQTNEALNKELTDLRNKNQVLFSENQSLKNNVASFEEKNKRFNALFDKLYAELKECKAINKWCKTVLVFKSWIVVTLRMMPVIKILEK